MIFIIPFLVRFVGWKALIKSPAVRVFAGRVIVSIITFLKPIASVTGWLLGRLFGSVFGWSMLGLTALFISGFRFIWNFNWNISDEDLLATLNAQKLAWYEQYGETVGEGLGWLVCGLTPAASLLVFNKPLALSVLLNTGEEAYEELLDSLAALLDVSKRQQLNSIFVYFFIRIRWFFKNAARGEGNTLAQGLINEILNKFPKFKEAVSQWGDKGGQPWRISTAVEEAIENAPVGDEWKTFLEGLIDGFGDACVEALFCFASAFDNAVAQQNVMNDLQEGEPNTVVLIPNREAPEQKYILYGTTEQLKPVLTTTLANHQTIDGKDVGRDLGLPLILRSHKQPTEYTLEIFLRARQKPPYGSVKKVQITIHITKDIDGQVLTFRFFDYDRIIRALGGKGDKGNIGYMYGNFLAKAYLKDGTDIQCWADTRDNAKLRIEAIADEMLDTDILTINITEEVKDYQRQKVDGLSKDIVRIYPQEMQIVRRTKVYNDYDLSNRAIPGKTTPTKQGYYANQDYTLDLWLGRKPGNWDNIINELTKPIAITPQA